MDWVSRIAGIGAFVGGCVFFVGFMCLMELCGSKRSDPGDEVERMAIGMNVLGQKLTLSCRSKMPGVAMRMLDEVGWWTDECAGEYELIGRGDDERYELCCIVHEGYQAIDVEWGGGGAEIDFEGYPNIAAWFRVAAEGPDGEPERGEVTLEFLPEQLAEE